MGAIESITIKEENKLKYSTLKPHEMREVAKIQKEALTKNLMEKIQDDYDNFDMPKLKDKALKGYTKIRLGAYTKDNSYKYSDEIMTTVIDRLNKRNLYKIKCTSIYGYPNVTDNSFAGIEALAEPESVPDVDDRNLHFCGEYTGLEYGFMDTACASGVRVTQDLLGIFKRNNILGTL